MNDRIEDQAANPHGDGGLDKLDLHHRQQLSALMDGALAPDEARFLLRRLPHDPQLADCWERWRIAGDVMRGQATVVLPAGFAVRVGEALAAEMTLSSAVPTRARPQWVRWGGGALAASVAVVALLMARQSPDAPPARAGTPIVATASAPIAPSGTASASVPATQADAAPAFAADADARLATAEAPRRMAQRSPTSMRRARGPARRIPAARDAADFERAVAVSTADAETTHPFATGTAPVTRPWPRAVLPQFGGSGVLAADSDSATSPSFYPFQPRLPEQALPADVAPPSPR